MNTQSRNIKSNRYDDCFSWIKSINIPICKKCSNINDLRNGILFLELIKYYFNYNKKNQNYLSLLNRANYAENAFERMNIIFHTMTKIINNNKIKSRIEAFHNNINSFLKSDNLIMEFLTYIIYLFQKNKNNKRISSLKKHQNFILNTNKSKNHSCSQVENNKKMNNLCDNSKFKRKIINYDTVKGEKMISNKEKNNFLFYITNKNEKIINIDNLLNFRFTNGIKRQYNNINSGKEINSYVTKPKIIKYHSQYFNKYKENMKNIDKNRYIKSEMNISNLKKYIKHEENKLNFENRENDFINVKDNIYNYNTYKPTNYNIMKNIIEEENELKSKNRDNNDFYINEEKEIFSMEKTDSNLFNNFHSSRNSSEKKNQDDNSIYELLKLTNNNIKNVYNEKLLEEKKIEEFEKKLNQISQEDKIKNQKRILYSRNNRQNRKKINNNSVQKFLNNNNESSLKKEIVRQPSFPNNIYTNNLKKIYDDTNYPEPKTQSYFDYRCKNNINQEINKNTKEKFNETKDNFVLNKNCKKEKIYSWLINLKLINREESNILYLPQLISDGKLLCDIINTCENENNPIEGISNDISIKENALMNIQKALNYLNKIEVFPKAHISDYEPIFEIDNKIIWGLLNDLYDYYANKKELNIKNNIQEENHEIISSDINNYQFIDKGEKSLKNNSKKSSMEMLDFNYIINNINNKNYSHKNANIKHILFKDEKNDSKRYNKTLGFFNDNRKNIDSYNNISIFNNKKNLMKNYSSNNINKKENNYYINSVNTGGKKKNYFYYVNAFKQYFDQEENQQKEITKQNNDSKNIDEIMSYYLKNKFEPFNSYNNNNKLYFDYSNNTYLNNRKRQRFPYNPINPDYYERKNYFSLPENEKDFDENISTLSE